MAGSSIPESRVPETFAPDPNLKVWLDGQLLPWKEAAISVFDHGLLYGDGVFEGIRSYSGRVFERIAHLDRLYRSAAAIQLQIPMTVKQVSDAIDAALDANGLLNESKDAYIRLVVTRGVGALGLSPRKTVDPKVFVIAADLLMYPEEMYEKGMPVIMSSYTRNPENATPPRIKSLNYLNNILAKIEALDADAGEAIMLNSDGYVAEATGDNVFIVREGQLQTPPTSAGILEGITRNTIIHLAREAGIETVEKNLVRTDLYTADEFFLTGTGAEAIPVNAMDGRPIRDGTVGPITKQLIKAYRELVRSAPDVRPE